MEKIEKDITKEEIKAQLAETVKENEFKSHLRQYANDIANLAEKVVKGGIERCNEDEKVIVIIFMVINPKNHSSREVGIIRKGKERPSQSDMNKANGD